MPLRTDERIKAVRRRDAAEERKETGCRASRHPGVTDTTCSRDGGGPFGSRPPVHNLLQQGSPKSAQPPSWRDAKVII